MRVCKVLGPVVATAKHPAFVGKKTLTVQPIDAQGERRCFVVELYPSLSTFKPIPIQPPRHEPLRMRMCDAEVGERRVAVGWIRRPPRQGQLMTLAQRCAQDGIDEATCARFPGRSRQIDRIVHDSGSGYATEMEELIKTQSEDGEYFAVECRDASTGEMFNEVIETSLPANGAGDNLRGERSVPFVAEVRATGVERRRQIGAAARHRTNRMVRSGPRRSRHESANVSPVARRCPRRKS